MDKSHFHDFIDFFFAVFKYFEFYSFLLKLLMSHSVKLTKNGFLNANHSFLWKIIMMRHFVSQNKEILNHNAMHHFFRQNNRRCTNQNIGNFLQATTLGELWSRLPWHWSLGTGILVTSLEWLVHFTITLLWESSWEVLHPGWDGHWEKMDLTDDVKSPTPTRSYYC